MADYLNQKLYDSLVSRFGEVLVSNMGEQAHAHHRSTRVKGLPTLHTNNGPKTQVEISGGEMYAVNCPFCGDERHRLLISYTWGTEVKGRHITHTAICFNESCNTFDLEDYLKPHMYDAFPKVKRVSNVSSTAAAPMEIPLPSNLVSLLSLPVDHVAIRYITSRGFTAQQLQDYHVTFCPSDFGKHAYYTADRLVFPFYADGKAIGYQTRSLDPNAKKLKYWICPGTKKTYTFFGLGLVPIVNRLVLVEGPFDVIRVGPGALGVSGKSLSYHQIDVLRKYYPMVPIYIMFDPDAYEDSIKARDRMIAAGCLNEIKVVKLTDKDPGDMTAQEIEEKLNGGL